LDFGAVSLQKPRSKCTVLRGVNVSLEIGHIHALTLIKEVVQQHAAFETVVL